MLKESVLADPAHQQPHQQDVRDSVVRRALGEEDSQTEKLLRSVDRMVPQIKLEVMGLNLMRAMLTAMWTLGIFNLIVVMIVLGAIARVDAPQLGEDIDIWDAVYYIEGITRTIGVLLLLMLLFAYPQRIIRHHMSRGQSQWAQRLVCVITLLMSIAPCYSLYEACMYWITLNDTGGDLSADRPAYSFGVIALLSGYSRAAIAYNTVITMIVLAFLFVVFGGVFHHQHRSAKMTETELYRERNKASWDDEFDRKSVMGDINADDDNELGDQQASRVYQEELALKAKSQVVKCYHNTRLRLRRIGARYMRVTGHLPFRFQVGAIIYMILSIALPISLEFHPSAIPIVSLITLGRICAQNVTDFLPFNETQFINETVEIGNLTFPNLTLNFMQFSMLEDDELGICSPSQDNPIAFRRSLSMVVFFVLELYLFFEIWLISTRTRVFLQSSSYAQTRREILGYYFFRHIAMVCWGFILLVGIVSTSVNPPAMYYLEEASINLNVTTNTLTVAVFLDPLFQTGVGFGTIGFGAYFTMVVMWIILLAFAYLPADAQGVKGWFTGTPMEHGEEKLTAAVRSDDYLILIPEESDVKQLLSIKRREEQRQRENLPLILGKYKSILDSVGQSSGALLYLPAIVSQVHANLLVLETEILNFHFMHLSYVLAGTKIKDPKTKERVPLTMEEKQALVEDKRFTLLEHVIDVETDTHVMVFSSADRVVVAFRGSVSLTNWQTDFDSAEVDCEYAVDIEPELSDVPPGAIQHAKNVASRPPKVHGGFVKAYETVRARITELCRQEMHNISDSPKVLFVTGHSLGGGLAIICALDLAVQLRLDPGRIAVTTWGAPKVGTYSFMRRFNRVCPSARRFCMADDPITKLPPDAFFQSIRLNGWWHCGTEILLNDVGNMLIRPTPIERFMLRSNPIGMAQAHLRMTYATALMLWVVRSHPDYEPDWWTGVVTLFYKNASKRLKPVPKNLRDRLLVSLLKAGVTYTHNNRTVRDMMCDTAYPNAFGEPKSHKLSIDAEDRGEEPDEELEVQNLVTELLVALRLCEEGKFNTTLDAILDLQAKNRIFMSNNNNNVIDSSIKTDHSQDEESNTSSENMYSTHSVDLA